jgi:hypothetical protein
VAELDRDKDDVGSGVTVRRSPRVGPGEGRGDAPARVEKQSDHPCFQCVQCCSYVAIEIDAPTSMKEYDYIVWYLVHRDVSVFVDWEGSWFIMFETRCEHLDSRGLCDRYSSRPAICKDFDWRECENRLREEPADKWLFETSDQFLRWLEKRRPKAFQRFQRYMLEKHGSAKEEELGRLKITRLPRRGR